MSKNEEITVTWVDAVGYYNFEEIPSNLSKKETAGRILRDEKDFIVLKNPKTKDYNPHNHRGVREKEKKPAFLFIPRGMILDIRKEK